jgi:hypothetical protein
MTNSANDPFAWRVLVLDDEGAHPSVVASLDALTQAGFSARLLSSPTEFKTAYAELRAADLALCDMKWKNFNSGSSIGRLPSAVTDDSSVGQWVDAVEDWVNAPKPRDAEWPRKAIDPSEVGLWLAAMVTRANPAAQIVLYTSQVGLADSGPLAALGHFEEAKFAVRWKGERDSLDLAVLLPSLFDAQRYHLQRRDDIRRWFLSCVLIPRLFNRPAVPRLLPGLHSAKNCEYLGKRFFPITNDISHLVQFLESPPPPPDWQIQALQSLKHKLDSSCRKRYSNAAQRTARFVR